MIREAKINGNVIKVELETEADESVFDEVFRDREYRVVDGVLEKAKVVIDIGAHIGCFSLYAASFGVEKIFAYEPEVRNFGMMKENLKLNKVRSVVAKNVAVGGEAGDRKLFLSGDSHNHSLIGDGESQKVRVVGFADLISRFEEVDLVKMDCEGAEHEIFEKNPELKIIKNFYIEYHPGGNKDALVGKLRTAGFKVESKPSSYDSRFGFIFAEKSL